MTVRPRLDLPAAIVPAFWGLFFLEATYGAYTSVWPLWIEHLGAPIAIVGIMLGIGGFLRIFVLAPAASIADRFGYRRVIVTARIVALLGFLGAAFSSHWAQLLLVIVAFAVGEMVFPLIQTIVTAEAGDQRMRAFALVFNVGPSIALAISPLIGAGAVALFGMRAAFVLAAIASAIAVIFLLGITNPTTLPVEASVAPATYRAAAREPGFRLVGTLLLITIFSLSFGVAFIPTFLKDIRGFSPSEVTALGALPAVGSAVFGLVVARNRRLQGIPFVTAAIPVGLMSIVFLIMRETAFLPLLCFAFFLRGGLFSVWAMLISALGELAPERLRTRSFALLEMIGGVAFAMGPIVAGVIYSRRATLPFEIAIVLALCLVPVFVLAQRKANVMPKQGSSGPSGDRDADQDRTPLAEPAV
ncbi:MAG: MFS transporter [Thermomicrobiales bacterium]|nr:MFS transporter [Thermomicrobiales bacterium]